MKLLVSVRDANEAREALAGGADWIDLKEPLQGPLGAVSAKVAGEVITHIGAGSPLSAALGELKQWPLFASRELLDLPQLKVVKLGLADCEKDSGWARKWGEAFEICSQHGKDLCAVVYADWREAVAPCPESILECAVHSGGKYLLIDTFDKRALSSIAILGEEQVTRLLLTARERGMTTVLAGNLSMRDIPILAALPADVVAVRGAVCHGQRTSSLDAHLVQRFRFDLEATLRQRNPYVTTSH